MFAALYLPASRPAGPRSFASFALADPRRVNAKHEKPNG
jgi:hypothetical protein